MTQQLHRRDFLKMCSAASLGVVGAGALFGPSRAEAASPAPYEGPLWVTVHASGGWDPTSFCDPKGSQGPDDPAPVNKYLAETIGVSGNHRYAPVAGNQAFFEKYGKKLLVVNGIDTATNGHDSGTRNVWSGKLPEGYPAFSAVVAGSLGADAPLAFLSNGGYDVTGSLVAPTRVGSSSVLTKLAWPNRIDPSKPDGTYHSPDTWDRVQAARAARLSRLQTNAKLPREAQALSLLYSARLGNSDLRLLSDVLPPTLDNSNNGLKRQAQLAVAAYKAGLAVSANLTIGGFDTHGNHDQNHFPRLQALTDGVDFLMEEAARQGVADRVVVIIGSDFGRTPWYNEGNGKDHWSITSMAFMGPGIPGDRVIGTTDSYHKPITVDPDTLETNTESGIRITPEHVHKALRQLAGIALNPTAQRFPLNVPLLPLFA